MLELVTMSARSAHRQRVSVLYDCRDLPNPYNITVLRNKTGKDKEVQDYLEQFEDVETMVAAASKRAICYGGLIGFMCFGGKHRSVAIAEMVAKRVSEHYISKQGDCGGIEITHYEL